MAEIEKFMNIAVGDIEKIMNIEKGDIAKVMGVELVTSIGYQGNRSLALGGFDDTYGSTENIEYKALTSDGDTLDFGDAAWDGSDDKRSCGSDSRAVFMGSHDSEGGGLADSNNTEYLTIASTGNGTEFGDLLVAGVTKAGGSGNGIRGLYVGGQLPSYSSTDQIQYLTVATTGNTTDAGNLDRAANLTIANANVAPGRMICQMGNDASGYDNLDFNYTAIMSTDNADDFGDASVSIAMAQPIGLSETRNVWAWGYGGGNHIDNMEYHNPSTLGNTTDFGDLQTIASNAAGKHTNGTRGETWGGEHAGSTKVQYITIASTGDATNAGDIPSGRRNGWDGWSGD